MNRIIIVLTVLLLTRLVFAQGNLVVNGGFDSDATGWTLAGGAYYNVKNGNPLPDVILAGIAPTASQAIDSLTPAAIYVVSGDYQYNGGGSSTVLTFGVALGGVYSFQAVAPASSSWQSFSFSYTATSSSAVLSLSTLNGTFQQYPQYSIDNIAMYVIPEPSSTVLLGFGGLMLLGGLSRRPRPTAAAVPFTPAGARRRRPFSTARW